MAAEKDSLIVTAFHPELTEDLRWHAHFLIKVMSKHLNRDIVNSKVSK